MRVVLDTNVLISALLNAASPAARLLGLWREGRFEIVTAAPQLDEVARVTRYPKIRERLSPALGGRLVNDLRRIATVIEALPTVEAVRDPSDNYLLALAQAANADYLVTGDKRDLLVIDRFGTTKITTLRAFALLFESKT